MPPLSPSGLPEPNVLTRSERARTPPDGRWRTWRPDGTEILLAEPLLTVH